MEARAIAIEPTDERRQARRAAELITAAVDTLREEIAEDGSLARSVERVARVSRSLLIEQSPHGFDTAILSVHEALSHAIAIGRAVHDALSPRAQQGLESLGAAQRVLYPLAKAHGVVAPPPPSHPPQVEGIERREFPRIEASVEVSFESETNFFQGFSEDISDGGLFIATYKLQPVGTVMEVEFTLPTGHIVRTDAEVRWLRDLREDSPDVHPGMGLRFLALLPEDARAIASFTRSRSPLFYDE